MVEFQRLVSAVSGLDGRNTLDARALADIEDAVFNSGRPEFVALYRRLLTDVDIDAEEANKVHRTLSFPRPSSVLRPVLAFVTNFLIFVDRITAARRNEQNHGDISHLSDYPG
jgi:hypothetical protein